MVSMSVIARVVTGYSLRWVGIEECKLGLVCHSDVLLSADVLLHLEDDKDEPFVLGSFPNFAMLELDPEPDTDVALNDGF